MWYDARAHGRFDDRAHERKFGLRQELQLLERAIRESWPVAPARRRQEMERLGQLLRDPATSPRLRAAALRIVLLAEKVNLGLPLPRPGPPRRPRRDRGRRAGPGPQSRSEK